MGWVVAIDGPAGAGKSSVARAVAKQTGLAYVDTGAIYRVLALAAKQAHVDPMDGEHLAKLTANLPIRFEESPVGQKVFLGQHDVSQDIRTEEISQLSSVVSQHKPVRAGLLELQRRLGDEVTQGAVLEGRDIGTVVFPNAKLKFFVTASEEERTRRRVAQLQQKGQTAASEEVLGEMRKRDTRDKSRDVAPLVPAADAIMIDTTSLPIDKVIETIVAYIRKVQEKNS
jgi:cytidylate kinase